MALRAIDVRILEAPGPVATTVTASTAPASLSLATVHELRPAPRMVTLAAVRRERRRWFAVGVAVFGAPFVFCLGVVGVVR
jgi:hypothetical protein